MVRSSEWAPRLWGFVKSCGSSAVGLEEGDITPAMPLISFLTAILLVYTQAIQHDCGTCANAALQVCKQWHTSSIRPIPSRESLMLCVS